MTDSLRLMCADILDEVAALQPVGRRAVRLWRGAETLRYAEHWEYGDPVPAHEHTAALDEYEQRIADLEHDIEQTNTAAVEHSKAFARLREAFVTWDEWDGERDDSALMDAFDAYRAAVA